MLIGTVVSHGEDDFQTVIDMADASGVSLDTCRRMERLEPATSQAGNVNAVHKALEAGGVIFIAENGGGPGVRLAKSDQGE